MRNWYDIEYLSERAAMTGFYPADETCCHGVLMSAPSCPGCRLVLARERLTCAQRDVERYTLEIEEIERDRREGIEPVRLVTNKF